MRKAIENPKRHIISCRIDDHEMKTLVEIARKEGTSISALLRQSLDQLSGHSFQATA